MIPQSIDKTTTSQKVIAGGLIVGLVAFLNWVAPVLENAVYSVIWIALLTSAWMFRKNFWNFLKDMVWSLTKFQIKLRSTVYLQRCYDYMLAEKEQIDAAINKISAVRMTEKGEIDEMQRNLISNKQRAEKLLSSGDQQNAAVWA